MSETNGTEPNPKHVTLIDSSLRDGMHPKRLLE